MSKANKVVVIPNGSGNGGRGCDSAGWSFEAQKQLKASINRHRAAPTGKYDPNLN
jgi:hypothetical protein